MTTILAENQNRDLFMDENNQIPLLTGVQAVLQACKSAIEAQRGEMRYAINRGIPTEQTLWNGPANQQQFQFYCRQALARVPNVSKVLVFDTEIVNNVLIYNATILTTFGEETLNGSL